MFTYYYPLYTNLLEITLYRVRQNYKKKWCE